MPDITAPGAWAKTRDALLLAALGVTCFVMVAGYLDSRKYRQSVAILMRHGDDPDAELRQMTEEAGDA